MAPSPRLKFVVSSVRACSTHSIRVGAAARSAGISDASSIRVGAAAQSAGISDASSVGVVGLSAGVDIIGTLPSTPTTSK